MIDETDANKILVSRKEPYDKKGPFINTPFNIMIMMTLNRFV